MAKLMFIHHSGLIGGAGVSLTNNVKKLSENNEVAVYVPSEPNTISELIKKQNSNVDVVEYGRRIGAITIYSGGDELFSKRFIYRLLLIVKQFEYWNKEIDKQSPDVVLINSKILCWMSLLPAIKKRKSILFVRETTQGNPNRIINRIIRSLLEGFSVVSFLCDFDRKQENLKIAKSVVVNNSINPLQLHANISRNEALEKLKLPKQRFVVLYVGGVSDMKGFDLAVQAVLQAGKEYELIVAGNNFDDIISDQLKEYAQFWKTYIKENDLYEQIFMVGRQNDMSCCYAACDVLLFPMRSMHQARPVFEAGYFGKPVIITDFECIKEFVKDGENGFTVLENSVSSIVDKLHTLQQNPSLTHKMGEANHQKAAENHDPERNFQKLKKVIEDTLSL